LAVHFRGRKRRIIPAIPAISPFGYQSFPFDFGAKALQLWCGVGVAKEFSFIIDLPRCLVFQVVG
jgi:hypothetical protein